MSVLVPPKADPVDKAHKVSVSLYDRNMRDIETIRLHYRLDTFSQAMRRCIEETVATVAHDEKDGPA